MTTTKEEAYENGYDCGYDEGYDCGYDEGYRNAVELTEADYEDFIAELEGRIKELEAELAAYHGQGAS